MPSSPLVNFVCPSRLLIAAEREALAHQVTIPKVLTAVAVMAAVCPPAEPQPREKKRTPPPNDYYMPYICRVPPAMSDALALLVPAVFPSRGAAMTWALAAHLDKVPDYFAEPAAAALLREAVAGAAGR